MGSATGVHHLAVNVQDVEEPLEFFTQACGMELVAFFWMHGVADAYHIFLRLDDCSSLALVRDPAQDGVLLDDGQRDGIGSPMTGGNMQHVSFNVRTEAALAALKDRIRAHGYQTFGPIDHGFCHSVYVPGVAERMTVEFSWSRTPIAPDQWIDPTCTEHAGLTEAQLDRYRRPAPFAGGDGAQPPLDPGRQRVPAWLARTLADEQRLSAFEAKLDEAR